MAAEDMLLIKLISNNYVIEVRIKSFPGKSTVEDFPYSFKPAVQFAAYHSINRKYLQVI
jgi:hypothetical protein